MDIRVDCPICGALNIIEGVQVFDDGSHVCLSVDGCDCDSCGVYFELTPKLSVEATAEPIYTITGVDTSGKRFKSIVTKTPWNYNIWRGTVWELKDGKRRRVRTIYN